jgi:hypothetical protein
VRRRWAHMESTASLLTISGKTHGNTKPPPATHHDDVARSSRSHSPGAARTIDGGGGTPGPSSYCSIYSIPEISTVIYTTDGNSIDHRH